MFFAVGFMLIEQRTINQVYRGLLKEKKTQQRSNQTALQSVAADAFRLSASVQLCEGEDIQDRSRSISEGIRLSYSTCEFVEQNRTMALTFLTSIV